MLPEFQVQPHFRRFRNFFVLNSGVFKDCIVLSPSESISNPQTHEGEALSKDKVVTKLNVQ